MLKLCNPVATSIMAISTECNYLQSASVSGDISGTEQPIGLKFALCRIETHSDDIWCYLNFFKMHDVLSLVPRLSPHVNEKSKGERGEPGKIYHVRNVIGRENLITCGRTNKFAHALLTEYTRSVAKALWLTERD